MLPDEAPFPRIRERHHAVTLLWRSGSGRARRSGWLTNQRFKNELGRTMMNRRQFMCAAATGAAIFARVPTVRAATFDLIIKGGLVIDPSVGLDAIRDVAIVGGKIAAVDANIAGDAKETIDARGKIVAPGLIHIPTHAGRSKEGPQLALQDGVTRLLDAGSGSAGTPA